MIPLQFALRRRMMMAGGGSAPISDLPLGTLINVGTDGGSGAPNYEIADINNFASDGVVLVRKDIHSQSRFGSSAVYPNSTLDNGMTSIYNSYPEKVKNQIMNATFVLNGSGSITRKVFALTYTMVGFGANQGTTEGAALQRYNSNTNRIKIYNNNNAQWWLSSSAWSGEEARVVHTDGSGFLTYDPSSTYYSLGVVPAFVIPSKTPYDPTPNTDGSYNLIL